MPNRKHFWNLPNRITAGLLLLGALFLLWKPAGNGLFPDKLYRYYPTGTQYYLELQPTLITPSQFLSALSRPTPFPLSLPQEIHQHLPAIASSKPSIPAILPQNELIRTLIQQYPNRFKPYFALGGWANPSTPSSQQLLLVLPLQNPKITPLQLFQPLSRQKTLNGKIYWVHLPSGTSLQTLHGHLLVATSAQTLATALEQTKNVNTPLLEAKRYQPYLQKLASHRQGTFLFNTAPLQTLGLKRAQQLAVLSPFWIGGFEEKPERVLRLDLYAPVDWTRIIQPALRQNIQAWLNLSLPLKSADYLPTTTRAFVALSGLDKLWDLYSALPQNKTLQNDLRAYQYLLASLKLDLRKDLVNLFSGEVSISLPSHHTPLLLASNTRQKASTLNKLTQLLSLSIFPLQQKSEQVADLPIQTVALTKSFRGFQNLQVSYGALDDMIIVAPRSLLDQVVKDHQTAKPPLSHTGPYETLRRQLPPQALGIIYLNLQASGLKTPIKALAGTFRLEAPNCLNTTLALSLQP